MNITEHYRKLYEDSIIKIKSNNYEIDPLINSNSDKRHGITLLIRPNLNVRNNIQSFLKELINLEPKQYYYPNTDIHITVASIISCHTDFKLEDLIIEDYINVIKDSLKNANPVKLNFKGLTASPSCIMVQGFMQNDSLNNIRNKLRTNFSNSGLEQSIDKRYVLQTAHSTVVRFREKFNNIADYVKVIEKYRDYNFGETEINNFEFVFNDWYMRNSKTKVLHTFNL